MSQSRYGGACGLAVQRRDTQQTWWVKWEVASVSRNLAALPGPQLSFFPTLLWSPSKLLTRSRHWRSRPLGPPLEEGSPSTPKRLKAYGLSLLINPLTAAEVRLREKNVQEHCSQILLCYCFGVVRVCV